MKKLVVMRGVPGSGKSTAARLMASLSSSAKVYSTDDFFIRDGKYIFHHGALGHAHCWNSLRCLVAMVEGCELLVHDNTNTQAWEPRLVVYAASLLGYEIEIVEPSTPWAFDADECAKKTLHGVPVETIRAMLFRWEHDLTVEKVLASKSPFEK